MRRNFLDLEMEDDPFDDFGEYDGTLIYTDGDAPPILSTLCTSLCWVLRSEQARCRYEAWMRKNGKVCDRKQITIKTTEYDT